MYEVFFEKSSGAMVSLGKTENKQEASAIMFKFLRERNYRVYYTRYLEKSNGEIKVDVGSYTEFFHFIPITPMEDNQ